MSDWRKKISGLVEGYSKVHVYAVDPGAVASLRPFYEEADKLGKAGYWFAEGWAANNAESDYVPTTQINSLLNAATAGEVVLMGQQVNFEQAYQRLKLFKQRNFQTLFVSDHWKDIATLFRPHAADEPLLPHRFLVPDQEAYDLQKNTLPTIGLSQQQINDCLEVFIHTGVERALDKIRQTSSTQIDELKARYRISGRAIIMLLDNVDRKGTELLGFGWQNCLNLAIAYMEEYEPEAKLLVKPHPRQSVREIEAHIDELKCKINIEIVKEPDAEPFIALCDEIWGMTTVLLVTAQRWGKPIRSFMAERTVIGALDSNAHIEPYTILNRQDFSPSRHHYPEKQSMATPIRTNYLIR